MKPIAASAARRPSAPHDFDNRGAGRAADARRRVRIADFAADTARADGRARAPSARTSSALGAARSPRSSRSRAPSGCAPRPERHQLPRRATPSARVDADHWHVGARQCPTTCATSCTSMNLWCLLAADLRTRGSMDGVAHGGRGQRARAERGRLRALGRRPDRARQRAIAWARSTSHARHRRRARPLPAARGSASSRAAVGVRPTRRDLVEGHGEHAVQHERETLGGRQRLEHDGAGPRRSRPAAPPARDRRRPRG